MRAAQISTDAVELRGCTDDADRRPAVNAFLPLRGAPGWLLDVWRVMGRLLVGFFTVAARRQDVPLLGSWLVLHVIRRFDLPRIAELISATAVLRVHWPAVEAHLVAGLTVDGEPPVDLATVQKWAAALVAEGEWSAAPDLSGKPSDRGLHAAGRLFAMACLFVLWAAVEGAPEGSGEKRRRFRRRSAALLLHQVGALAVLQRVNYEPTPEELAPLVAWAWEDPEEAAMVRALWPGSQWVEVIEECRKIADGEEVTQ